MNIIQVFLFYNQLQLSADNTGRFILTEVNDLLTYYNKIFFNYQTFIFLKFNPSQTQYNIIKNTMIQGGFEIGLRTFCKKIKI